jgi:uncharacterized membrane protein (GlpM family)
MAEYLLRFVLGGLVVLLFAVLGDLLRPKSFAGLFGAAPSVALATLGIAVAEHGSSSRPRATQRRLRSRAGRKQWLPA